MTEPTSPVEQPKQQPTIDLPEFKLVEKKRFRTFLPHAAIAMTSLTAITAATYFASKAGVRDGLASVTFLFELTEQAKDGLQKLDEAKSQLSNAAK
jgi:hypothetical protein